MSKAALFLVCRAFNLTLVLLFLEEYLTGSWENPEELFWVGKYAADAHKIFIQRRWRTADVQPDDHALACWVEWKRGADPSVLALDAEADKL